MTGVVALSGGLLGSLNKMFANRWNTTLLLQKFMNKRDQSNYNNLIVSETLDLK